MVSVIGGSRLRDCWRGIAGFFAMIYSHWTCEHKEWEDIDQGWEHRCKKCGLTTSAMK